MIELVVGFAIAAVLLIAEYLLCTKEIKKSSLGRSYSRFNPCRNDLDFCQWQNSSGNKIFISVCYSKHPVFWRLGNRPRQIQEN